MVSGAALTDDSLTGIADGGLNSDMPGGSLYDLSPLGRVAMAAVPVAVALLLRLMYGRTRTTEILLTLATSWFLVNVFIAPNSIEIERELYHLLPFAG